MADEKSISKNKEAPNPYEGLGEEAFWRTAVAEKSAFDIRGLWTPKFQVLPKHRILTAGSCFAQHFSRALVAKGYNWVDAEPGPPMLLEDSRKKFNYGVFSFRTGNIYTARAFRQWIEWALDLSKPPEEVWEKDGRFYDPFRPAIEPDGFVLPEEVFASRNVTLAAIQNAVKTANFFVFTMGLTESWFHKEHGYEYAMCPGTVAGTFDDSLHGFRNQNYLEIQRDLRFVIQALRKQNRGLRILLTVSPVPLTATATGGHVLTSTMHSKSTLRAVAGDLAANHKIVDYFPSYETITSAPYRGMFFEPNLRSVNPQGVSLVMENFFHDQERCFGAVPRPKGKKKQAGGRGKKPNPVESNADLVCEEEILNAFAN